MEKQNENIRSWDDLIFENRNKAYGAYAIRQEYSMGVAKGALTGIGILISIFVVAGFINSNSSILPKVSYPYLLILFQLKSKRIHHSLLKLKQIFLQLR